jgi:hypothetical protein
MNVNNVGAYQPTGYNIESVSDKIESFKFKIQLVLGTLKDQINEGNYTTAKLYTEMFLENIDVNKANNGTVIEFYRVIEFIDRALMDDKQIKDVDKSKLIGIINTLMSSFD